MERKELLALKDGKEILISAVPGCIIEGKHFPNERADMRKQLAAIAERMKRYRLFRFLFRHGEPIRYAVVGGLTTLLNFAVYLLCTRLFFATQFEGNPELYAVVFNWVAWGIAVCFAFFTNRGFVFSSRDTGGILVLQFLSFAGFRLLSGVVENFAPSLLIRWLSFHDLAAKLLIAIIVILLNYFFAKFITFSRRKSANREDFSDL